jgi:hypothetical protein
MKFFRTNILLAILINVAYLAIFPVHNDAGNYEQLADQEQFAFERVPSTKDSSAH